MLPNSDLYFAAAAAKAIAPEHEISASPLPGFGE
jgi:hypothetical protein